MTELKTTPSEENTLSSKGYKLLKFVGEGAYAKVEYPVVNSKNTLQKYNI